MKLGRVGRHRGLAGGRRDASRRAVLLSAINVAQEEGFPYMAGGLSPWEKDISFVAAHPYPVPLRLGTTLYSTRELG
jgi:hypothetical protein